MNEEQWIERIRARFARAPRPGTLGVGDDAAVWTPPPGQAVVTTVDTMVEGVHFLADWLDDAELASRAIRVALSDLAAMAARPAGVLLAIESPRLPGRVGERFWDGVAAELEVFELDLFGGNVTRTEGPASISVTAVGFVAIGHEVRRDEARPGYELWVTGFPGRAAAARAVLARGGRENVDAWVRPEPRIQEALHLEARGNLRAAIDVSDGLGLDLSRLLRASGVGAEIDTSELETQTALDPETILDGGEDYELLFAAAPDASPDPSAFAAAFAIPLTRLGTVAAASGLRTTTRSGPVDYVPRGWDPFATTE